MDSHVNSFFPQQRQQQQHELRRMQKSFVLCSSIGPVRLAQNVRCCSVVMLFVEAFSFQQIRQKIYWITYNKLRGMYNCVLQGPYNCEFKIRWSSFNLFTEYDSETLASKISTQSQEASAVRNSHSKSWRTCCAEASGESRSPYQTFPARTSISMEAERRWTQTCDHRIGDNWQVATGVSWWQRRGKIYLVTTCRSNTCSGLYR